MQGNFSKYFIREYAPRFYKKLCTNAVTGAYNGATSLASWIIERELEQDGITMARPKSGKQQSTPLNGKKPVNKTQWLNYKLSDAEIVTVLSDCEDTQELGTRLLGLFASGIGFSIRYNGDRANWSAFAISGEGGDDGASIGISAFGGSQWQALSALLYKCDVYNARPDALTESGQGMGIG